jgi:hypothetical protein
MMKKPRGQNNIPTCVEKCQLVDSHAAMLTSCIGPGRQTVGTLNPRILILEISNCKFQQWVRRASDRVFQIVWCPDIKPVAALILQPSLAAVNAASLFGSVCG